MPLVPWDKPSSADFTLANLHPRFLSLRLSHRHPRPARAVEILPSCYSGFKLFTTAATANLKFLPQLFTTFFPEFFPTCLLHPVRAFRRCVFSIVPMPERLVAAAFTGLFHLLFFLQKLVYPVFLGTPSQKVLFSVNISCVYVQIPRVPRLIAVIYKHEYIGTQKSQNNIYKYLFSYI